jgi:hypothetical protein
MSKATQFDPHAFAGRRQHPVNARKTAEGWISSGIAFEDYTRFNTQTHKQSAERRLPTPDWAVNDSKLRKLLVTFMEERAGMRRAGSGTQQERLAHATELILGKRPRMVEVLKKLCNEYVTLKQLGLKPESTDAEWNAARQQPYIPLFEGEARHVAEQKRRRELEIEIEGLDTYLRYTVNGGADVIAAIVYLYYRAGLDSVGVGSELGLKPPHVRQTLWRLHDTWNHKFAGGPKHSKSSEWFAGPIFDGVTGD